jgi:hypothetical protein
VAGFSGGGDFGCLPTATQLALALESIVTISYLKSASFNCTTITIT